MLRCATSGPRALEGRVRARLLRRERLPDFSPRVNGVGIPDVVSAHEVIEIKRACYWHHGMGQVLRYHALGYPRLQPRLHVFGSRAEVLKVCVGVLHTCQTNDPYVKVTFDIIEPGELVE